MILPVRTGAGQAGSEPGLQPPASPHHMQADTEPTWDLAGPVSKPLRLGARVTEAPRGTQVLYSDTTVPDVVKWSSGVLRVRACILSLVPSSIY